MSIQSAPFLSPNEKALLHAAGYTSIWQISNTSPVELWRYVQQQQQPSYREKENDSDDLSNDNNNNCNGAAPTTISSLGNMARIIERCRGDARKAKTTTEPQRTPYTLTPTRHVSARKEEQVSKEIDTCSNTQQGLVELTNNSSCCPTPLCTAVLEEGGEEEARRSTKGKDNQPKAHDQQAHQQQQMRTSTDFSSRPLFTMKSLAELLREEEGGVGALTQRETSDANDEPQQHQQYQVQTSNRIVTFSETIDELCGGGGVECGCLTEICGAPGMGKTQLAMQLAVAVQLPALFGGLDGDCLYIDTEGSFVPSRFAEIASGAAAQVQKIIRLQHQQQQQQAANDAGSLHTDFTPENIMKRLHYIRVRRLADLLALIESLPQSSAVIAGRNRERFSTTETPTTRTTTTVEKTGTNLKRSSENTTMGTRIDTQHKSSNIRLIIIDSVAFHFRSALGGDPQLRSRTLFHVGQTLQRHAKEMNAAIVVTNQLSSDRCAPNEKQQQQQQYIGSNRNGEGAVNHDDRGNGSNLSSPRVPCDSSNTTFSKEVSIPTPALGDAWAQTVTYRMLIQQATQIVVRDAVFACDDAAPAASAPSSRSVTNGKSNQIIEKGRGHIRLDANNYDRSALLQRRQAAVSAIMRDQSVRTMTLLKSPSRGKMSNIFRITSRGIRNVNVAL